MPFWGLLKTVKLEISIPDTGMIKILSYKRREKERRNLPFNGRENVFDYVLREIRETSHVEVITF